MKSQLSVNIPDNAKVVPEIEDYIFEEKLVGMSYTNRSWARYVASKFNATEHDVYATIEYMITMEYLIEDGVFGFDILWQINPEYA